MLEADTDGQARGGRLPRDLATHLGGRVVDVRDVTSPWATGTRSFLVTSADGQRVVVQRSEDASSLEARVAATQIVRDVAPALPVPRCLDLDVRGPVGYATWEFIDGESGRSFLDTPERARLLGSVAGRLVADLREVPSDGLPLDRRWSEPSLLPWREWLARSLVHLDPGVAAALERVLTQRLPHLVPASVLCHGDIAPVNLLLAGSSLTGLLDLEQARVGHPLYDAAWFMWVVRYHHPERWADLEAPFLEAAGLGSGAELTADLVAVAALQCLAALAGAPTATLAADWARKLSAIAGWA